MSVQQIPNKLLSLNSQEINLLQELINKEKKVCRRSVLSIGRWTERLEQHFHILLDLADKVEEAT